MPNEWLIKDLSAAYLVFRWRPLDADEKAAEYIPTTAVISSWLDDVSLQGSMSAMYESALGMPAGKMLAPNRKQEIIRQLQGAFQRRILICLRATRVVPGAKSEEGEKAAPPPAPPPPRPTKTKTWIEIELVDDKGKPVVGERYRIVLPDGSQEEDHLDGHGCARINNLDPGECQISFPDIDGREWSPA
jgi:hypothetical protein